MRKILSLGLFLATATMFAQPYTETFDNLEDNNSSQYSSEHSFTGVEGIVYDIKGRTQMAGQEIDGNGVILRKASDNSYVIANYTDGLSFFSFQYRRAFSKSANRHLDLYINDNFIGSTADFGPDTEVYTYTVDTGLLVDYNQPGMEVVVKIVNPSTSDRQSTVDNFVWAPYDPTAAINNNAIDGLRVYPNPAKDIVTIATDAGATKNVQVFDIVGKKVMENTIQNTLNISGLNKGVYILKIEENGKIATKKLVVE